MEINKPNEDWFKKNSKIIFDCCEIITFYTNKGNILLNSALRNDSITEELNEFYIKMKEVKNNLIPLNITTKLYR